MSSTVADRPECGATSPALSIVIPTYNRAPLLRYLLTSICDDFVDWPDDLELVVIDNASTDDTVAVVEHFQAFGIPIRLLRNAANLGMDGNLAACFGTAHGHYLWQIGDDELLYRGAASYVLDFCRTREFGILHLANDGFDHGAQEVLAARRIPQRIDVAAVTARQLLRLANVYLTFISANVVNRLLIKTTEPDFDPHVAAGTSLPQLAWTYAALRATDRHFHIRMPLFGALAGNTGGYKLIEVFGFNLRTITDRHLGGILRDAGAIMTNAVITRVVPGELMAQARRAGGGSVFQSEDTNDALRRAFGRTRYFRWLVRHLLASAKWRRDAAFFVIRVFNRFHRRIGYRLL